MSWQYSSVELLEEMKKNFPTLMEKCDNNCSQFDCWCNHLDPNQFPFLMELIKNNNYDRRQSCPISEPTVRRMPRGCDILEKPRRHPRFPKEPKKRARMAENIRKERKNEAVRKHRKRIADMIESAKISLAELEKKQKQLDDQNQILHQIEKHLNVFLNVVKDRMVTHR